jgi:hypothetical protein
MSARTSPETRAHATENGTHFQIATQARREQEVTKERKEGNVAQLPTRPSVKPRCASTQS